MKKLKRTLLVSIATLGFSVSPLMIEAQATHYSVVAGDTLWKVAKANGVTVAELKQWNNLTSDLLQIGQKLTVSATTPETPETPTEPSTVYTVVAGDSLWKIANAHGVTVSQIKQWNNLTSDFLQIGQKLKLTGTTAPETPEEPSEPSTVYTVVAGDSLWKIANAHGVTVAQIKQWNNLTSDFLQIGQKLKLTGTTAPETPEEPSEPSTVYTVVAGDSLWKIANAHGVTVAQIKQWNNLTSDFLQIGQKLKLTGTTAPETPEEPSEPSTVYTVVAGDSLWKIANAHGVTVAQIKQWNNLTSDFLQIGQKLKLAGTAAPEEPSKQYTVVKGDSLWTIAKANGTTVAKIKQLNNLTSDFLQIGQKLTIK
ncbi:LysM peptidoglycan-binding domain-containing protein [Globicatella sulfidifaciens]